jgi:hypothetical protein
MGCKPSCICYAPEAGASGTNGVSAHASPVQGTAPAPALAPNNALAPAATVVEPAPNALPAKPSLIEGLMINAKQQKLIHTARVLAEPLLILLIYAIQQV